jgi:glycosyltransferase involved in cell wall biosynthesis
MRVLAITPTPSHPPTQGNRVRVTQICEGLKRRGAQVDLLYYAIDGMDEGWMHAMRAAWDALYVVPSGGFAPRRSHAACWGIDDWVSPALIEAARFLAGVNRYDVVIVNYVWLSLLLTLFDKESTRRVLDTHDAFGDRHVRARAAGLQPHWFYTTPEEEARGLARADLVIAIQCEEEAYFRSLTGTPVETLEYAIAPSYLPPRSAARLRIGYLGSGNPWNVRGVQAFDQALAAAQDASLRQADFLLFGGITTNVGPLRVFQPMGMVDEVEDAYRAVDLLVNPMVGGTGLKIKTIEALAYGRPVVSTRAGATGLEGFHADLLHPDLASLLERTAELIRSPGEVQALRTAMCERYRALHERVENRFAEVFGL